MESTHKIYFENSASMLNLDDNSVDLIVTSPPYPMIEMWDEVFTNQNKKIGDALRRKDGKTAFELMHQQLDRVWDEVYRVLKSGGIACINIGDATRTINDNFALYTNHSRIHTYMQKIGFSALPAILWRKQTNAPNKFMGSGMMPPGAYVTLEHEYIVVLRKGSKKEFLSTEQKKMRRESSFFWEERNCWFSDVWMDLKGTTQTLFDNKTRNRSAAYPFELPYRLISMFSVKGDTILDPFMGVGTTMYAAIATGRNSVGYEIDSNFSDAIRSKLSGLIDFSNRRINERLQSHLEFVESYFKKKGEFKYENKNYRFPVVTRQELDLLLNEVKSIIELDSGEIVATYSSIAQSKYTGPFNSYLLANDESKPKQKESKLKKLIIPHQQDLFK